MSAKCCPVPLFKITQTLLGQEVSDVHIQGHAEEFKHSMDKVAWIHSQLEPMHGTDPFEMPGKILSGYCGIIWPIEPDEMDRVFDAVSATTYQLDLCPSWLVKVKDGDNQAGSGSDKFFITREDVSGTF